MKKILIIEDDPSFADELQAELAVNHAVEICPDGQSGYYAIYEFKPDAVLLDLTIGQMGAVSLVGKIKAQKQFNRLPILVLADAGTMSAADEAIAVGASEAFLKDEEGAAMRVAAAITQKLTPTLARQAKIHQPVPAMIPATTPAMARIAERQFAAVNLSPGHSYTGSLSIERSRSVSAEPIDFNRNRIAPVVPPRYVESEELAISESQPFLDSYGHKAHSLRVEFITYRTAQGPEQKASFRRFLDGVCALHREARQSGFIGLAMYLAAIELRVQQLLGSLDAVTAPSLQTLASALDVLAALNNHLGELRPLNHMHPHAMVVDDESVSRKALCLGLEKAQFKATPVDNPDAAIHEAENTPFDIIFLDVELPKMNGFALCARLRLIGSHRKTPILFVTALSDMRSRASSRVSGGNQFLTKPLNYPELTVNAWTLVIRKRILEDGRLERARS